MQRGSSYTPKSVVLLGLRTMRGYDFKEKEVCGDGEREIKLILAVETIAGDICF